MRLILISVSLLISFNVFCQNLKQSIEGVVLDNGTKSPVSGASIILFDNSGSEVNGTNSDEHGKFLFANLELGRYKMTFSHIGYDTHFEQEVLLTAARPVFLEIALNLGTYVLDDVQISDRTQQIHVTELGKRPITVEQTLRYAASFYDPARLSTSLPGVTTANDQNNNIVVRGNSPNGILWRLEGVDIVNPNHLSNAGTFGDRATQSGGSVNILSSQLLGNTSFLNGAFDASYGNAYSGVFDMNYRKGDQSKARHTLQASLIGFDLATEGPLAQNKTSYLVNYRYSTVGLLDALGVPLGDESINFQDLSFNLTGTTDSNISWSIFGLGGNHKNQFEASRDSSEWEFEKDSRDISYEGYMYGVGTSITAPFGARSFLTSTLAFSQLENERVANQLDGNLNPQFLSSDVNERYLLSWRAEYSTRFGEKRLMSLGYHLNNDRQRIASETDIESVAEGKVDTWLVQPFLNFSENLSTTWSYNLGIRYVYHSASRSESVEPRLGLKWQFSSENSVDFRYGRHSIAQLPGVYAAWVSDDINLNRPNFDLELSKADHFVLGFNRFGKASGHFQAEFYYQNLSNIPVSAETANSFSTLNQIVGFVFEKLENSGTGYNYGLDLSYEKTYTNNIYYLVTGSFYQSKYKGSDGIERDTRFNGNYAFNFTGGKEFDKSKNGFDKTFSINLKALYIGGFRDTPIDVVSSEAAGRTVYFEDEAFTIKMQDYIRLDIRLAWVKNKPSYTRTISLDIQNLANIENIAYSYYDLQQQMVVAQNQLGIIPILAYRVEF